MLPVKAIIVDDERFNQDLLLSKIQQLFTEIKVVSLCRNGQEALNAVTMHKPALVFLDIEMPVMDGFEF